MPPGPMSFHCPHEPREACSRFCCRGGGPCIGHSSIRFLSQATGFDPAPLPRCRAPGPPAACFQGSAAIPNPPTRRRAGVLGWAKGGHPIAPRLPTGRLQVVFLLITSFAWSTVLSEVLGPWAHKKRYALVLLVRCRHKHLWLRPRCRTSTRNAILAAHHASTIERI